MNLSVCCSSYRFFVFLAFQPFASALASALADLYVCVCMYICIYVQYLT